MFYNRQADKKHHKPPASFSQYYTNSQVLGCDNFSQKNEKKYLRIDTKHN